MLVVAEYRYYSQPMLTKGFGRWVQVFKLKCCSSCKATTKQSSIGSADTTKSEKSSQLDADAPKLITESVT